MRISELKELFVDLIVVPTKEFSNNRDKWERIFNSNFSIGNAFRAIESTEEDVLSLMEDPNVESNAVKHFFEKALPFYTPENCLLLKPKSLKVFGTKDALSEEELFQLFKELFAPNASINWEKESEVLIEKFNSNFCSDGFFEVLYNEFYWDEIYENPDEFDDEIRIKIKEELRKVR